MRLVKKAVTFGLWNGDQRLELNVIGSTAQTVSVGRGKPGNSPLWCSWSPFGGQGHSSRVRHCGPDRDFKTFVSTTPEGNNDT
jgi:hypothetical protein